MWFAWLPAVLPPLEGEHQQESTNCVTCSMVTIVMNLSVQYRRHCGHNCLSKFLMEVGLQQEDHVTRHDTCSKVKNVIQVEDLGSRQGYSCRQDHLLWVQIEKVLSLCGAYNEITFWATDMLLYIAQQLTSLRLMTVLLSRERWPLYRHSTPIWYAQ